MTAETIVAFIAFLVLIVAWIRAPAGSPMPSAAPAVEPPAVPAVPAVPVGVA